MLNLQLNVFGERRTEVANGQPILNWGTHLLLLYYVYVDESFKLSWSSWFEWILLSFMFINLSLLNLRIEKIYLVFLENFCWVS
jgi:hypothetical protein